jgi:thioredoxin-like negative regulator of GroEL
LENERLTEQLRLLSQPVSDEEQERFMESARQTIADEYMRTWDELASDAMQFSETATDILLDLVRTEASLKAIAARSAAPWKEVKDGN